MNTTNSNLNKRTGTFALRIIRLYSALPKSTEAVVIGKQLLRSGTSVGAHYSEANFAKDFVNKIEGALQELEETVYWLALMEEAKIGKMDELAQLQAECRELIAFL